MAISSSSNFVKSAFTSGFQSSLINTMIKAIVAGTAVLALAVCSQSALAQFESIPMNPRYATELPPFDADEDQMDANKKANRASEKNQRDDLSKIRSLLSSGGSPADNPLVEQYFKGYVFPSMTIVDNRVLSQLGDMRAKFLKDFFDPRISSAARAALIDLTIQQAREAYRNNSLHPAARLNMVYLIGMLDQTPGVRLPPQFPVPSESAFDSLGDILKSADLPAFLKVAALAGIQRHVEIDNITNQGQLTDADKTFLTEKGNEYLDAPSQDDLSYWLKRRGMQLLGELGAATTLKKAVSVIQSKDTGFWVKFDAMEAIGKLNLAGNDAAESLAATKAIAEFASSALLQESEAINGAIKQLVYDQILFQDLDLIATPTDYSSGASVSGSSGAGGGGTDGGRSGGGKFSGGSGMGMGMGAGMGAGAGGLGASNEMPAGEILELPVYQLNVFRRRIKTIALTTSQILGGADGTGGMAKLVDDTGKDLIKKVNGELASLLQDSNVGIVDLDARKTDEEDEDAEPKSVANQLAELCDESSKKIDKLLGKKDPAEADPLGAATK
ncbi:MAG: hypothetical protein P8R31_09815 [Mariniblastus sp.]|nr:hypothetical protein [Mariniblastus sp.]